MVTWSCDAADSGCITEHLKFGHMSAGGGQTVRTLNPHKYPQDKPVVTLNSR